MNLIETNLTFTTKLTKRKATNRIIAHHGAGSGKTVEELHQMHIDKNGYSGIGYHIYIRKDGSAYEGRPLDTIGAHAQGSNSDSIGICFEGNFEEEYMTDAQKQTGKEVIAYLKNLYNISEVLGHRDVNATACPGKNFPFDEIASATMPTGGEWVKDDKGYWYKYSDGSYPKNTWLLLDAWYYFDNNGYAVQDDWAKVEDEWYYFDEECRMIANAWREIDGLWYYFDESGAMVKGIRKIKDETFYFHEEKGHMCRTNDRGALV